MESNCMVAKALKPSLRGELSMKPTTQQILFDDTASVEDYFSIDCFLDIPVGHEEEEDEEEEEEDEEEEEKDSLSISSQEDSRSSIISATSHSLLSTQLVVPLADEDRAELEWVSHFVDDSLSELSLLYHPAAATTERRGSRRRFNFLFPNYQLPGKARTKRSRPTSLSPTWSVGSPLTESSSSSSSPTSSSFSTTCLILSHNNNNNNNNIYMVRTVDPVHEPPEKKLKRGPPVRTGGETGLTQFLRRCSHCLVQKTPQWRTGPLGPKTLCNACGVRYKSGRLFPEYRPACSPTFSSDIHSNSHRKVLEMRKRKEIDQPVSGFSQMVSIF